MHMKTHFSSISSYRDLSLSDFLELASLMCISHIYIYVYVYNAGTITINANIVKIYIMPCRKRVVPLIKPSAVTERKKRNMIFCG